MVAARNPLIDRYYSPLGIVPDFEEYEREMSEKRGEAIAALEAKRLRAAEAGRNDEVADIQARIRRIKTGELK
ncbi:MAG TPA: hypothetical protein VM733_11585 [Thermoanaerobaculia bacterium]|nr:hypothetical protein [Thermoanaerobaculia bacterium]